MAPDEILKRLKQAWVVWFGQSLASAVTLMSRVEVPQGSRDHVKDQLLFWRKEAPPSAQIVDKSMTVSAGSYF